MVRLSINEMTTYGWPFEKDVACLAEAGVSAIGVWREKLSDYGVENGIELLAANDLSVSNLLWAGGFTGSDGRTYGESIEDAEEAISLASSLHARCVVVYSGARNGHTRNHACRLMRSALRELAPMASDFEVTLAVEPMHRGCASDWTFLTDLGETLDLIGEVGSSRVQLAFDTYHLGHDPSVLEAIPRIVDQIAVVHLGDGKALPRGEQNRCRLGDGRLPLGDLIDALLEAGYDGDFDVELMGEDIEMAGYGDRVRHSVRAFETLVGAENCRAPTW